MTFNSYQRVTAKENKYNTFQDQEKITALDLNWIQFKWRNHDPSIGRFFNVDPLASEYFYNSPYAFSENKLISYRELEGLEAEGVLFAQELQKDYEAIKANIAKGYNDAKRTVKAGINRLKFEVKEGFGDTQTYGQKFYTPKGGPSPTKYTATFIGPPTNIELLMMASGFDIKKFIPRDIVDRASDAKDIVEGIKDLSEDLENEKNKEEQEEDDNAQSELEYLKSKFIIGTEGRTKVEYFRNSKGDTIKIQTYEEHDEEE